INRLLRRLSRSAVVWSWGTNFLRLASGVLVLPLLIRFLDVTDLGFYYVVLPLLGIVPMLDLGLASSVERSVSYAMRGARELKARGIQAEGLQAGQPNSDLLWKIVHATRAYYNVLALVVFVMLGIVGSAIVAFAAKSTAHPATAWLAWSIALVNATLEIYAGW